MTNFNLKLQNIAENHQGTAARLLNKLPKLVQLSLAKTLGYPYDYPELDPFIKCLMAVQLKQGKIGFIGSDVEKSRQHFEKNMKSIVGKPTAIKRIENLKLNLESGLIHARHYHPAPNKKLPLIVFYHGGGFVVGSVNTHDEACRLLAIHANAQVLSIDYPLAPEVSPNTLIQTCEEALAWAYKNKKDLKIYKNRIAVAGDSAGGNIATVVSQKTVGKSYAPSAQLLIYPTVDFQSRYPSFNAYKDGLVLTGTDINNVTEFYASQHSISLDDPLISPIFGNLKKLPPSFILTAGHDLLHDEAEIYAEKLKQEGNKVSYLEYKDQTHGFINFTTISKTSKRITIEVARNFRKFWDKHA